MVYDEEASAAWHMDVVHEIPGPGSASAWVAAQRRLNTITDPLARRLIELHRDSGSGTGECDPVDDLDDVDAGPRIGWGCETTRLIAEHYNIASPD